MLSGYFPLSTFGSRKGLLWRTSALISRQLTCCILCGESDQQTDTVCKACQQSLPVNHDACSVCALPMSISNTPICADCLQHPKPFHKTYSPFIYTHPVDHLIHEVKHSGSWLLEQFLCSHWRSSATSKVVYDCVIPVPAKPHNLKHRGFSHSHNLAAQLAQHLQLPLVDALHYQTIPATQKTLGRQQRLQNLKGAFETKRKLTELRIALVDDVMTTGATAIAASEALLAGGACKVDVFALARTPSWALHPKRDGELNSLQQS